MEIPKDNRRGESIMAIFDYDTSVLNPTLKIIIPLIYVGVIYLYWKTTKAYKGSKMQGFLKLLMIMSIFGFLGALARYLGHGTDFGFTKELSLKWFQSIFYLVQAGVFIYAGKKFLGSS